MSFLRQYMRMWQLNSPEIIAQTPTSHIYKIQYEGQTVALKILTPRGVVDEHAGMIALGYFSGRGAVQLLRHDSTGYLMEYLDGRDLLSTVKQGNDEEATYIITDVLNKLHSVDLRYQAHGLIPLRVWFRSLFVRAKQYTDSIYAQAAHLANMLLDHPQDESVLHGDIHHENIRYHSTRGWLAFDPKGLFGERTFDVANTLCNPIKMPELVQDKERLFRNARILSENLDIDMNRIFTFTFIYACLSASWSLEDNGDPSLALSVANIVKEFIST